MFTGLIEEIGEVRSVADQSAGRRILLRASAVMPGMARGDSVAVNGVCQTVAALIEPDSFAVIAVEETMRRTTFGSLRSGSRVNLERPLRLGDRLGGHWVNGHVDGTGRILETRRTGRDLGFCISTPPGLARYTVEKGSIAVDGVSLTLGEVNSRGFWVYIIPETRERTLFGRYRVGDSVNLEVDILAKYVERALRAGSLEDRQAPASLQILERWSREKDNGLFADE
jgi:riboflavin synthase